MVFCNSTRTGHKLEKTSPENIGINFQNKVLGDKAEGSETLQQSIRMVLLFQTFY